MNDTTTKPASLRFFAIRDEAAIAPTTRVESLERIARYDHDLHDSITNGFEFGWANDRTNPRKVWHWMELRDGDARIVYLEHQGKGMFAGVVMPWHDVVCSEFGGSHYTLTRSIELGATAGVIDGWKWELVI